MLDGRRGSERPPAWSGPQKAFKPGIGLTRQRKVSRDGDDHSVGLGLATRALRITRIKAGYVEDPNGDRNQRRCEASDNPKHKEQYDDDEEV
jgi:hypothetical protein